MSINWPSLVTSWFGVQKMYSKMHLISGTNTHHDITDLVNHGIVKNTKTWISWELNIIFLQNEKILNLCFRCHILRSYHFVAELTFKDPWNDKKMWFNAWNFLICVMALSICIISFASSFNKWLGPERIKKCSVSHSVAGQHLILAKKILFWKKKKEHQKFPIQSLCKVFCIKIMICIIFVKVAAPNCWVHQRLGSGHITILPREKYSVLVHVISGDWGLQCMKRQ